MSKFRLHPHSIFIKLLAIIIVMGILIAGVIFAFYRIHLSKNIKSRVNANIQNYFTYIASDLGSPPDTLRARQMADKYSILIVYHSKKFSWSSGDIGTRHDVFKLAWLFKDDGFIVFNDDGSRYIFDSDFHKTLKPAAAEFGFLIFAVVIILALGFFIIKRMLKPVKLLSAGIEELGRGNLSISVPVTTSSDELALLTGSFNKMTARIKEMLISRDRLLADVSHELRTPLTRIKVALEFIEEGKTKELISSDVKELEMMITTILNSENLRNGSDTILKESNDLSELVKEAADSFNNNEPGIVIEKLEQPLIFKFDYNRIKIVLNNLIDNALKYSRPESKPVIISVTKEAANAVIKITDDGTGIPPEDIPLIFEPFYRADRSRSKKIKGFGLGLSICKKIIDAHGGSISVANNTTRGITVTVVLPI